MIRDANARATFQSPLVYPAWAEEFLVELPRLKGDAASISCNVSSFFVVQQMFNFSESIPLCYYKVNVRPPFWTCLVSKWNQMQRCRKKKWHFCTGSASFSSSHTFSAKISPSYTVLSRGAGVPSKFISLFPINATRNNVRVRRIIHACKKNKECVEWYAYSSKPKKKTSDLVLNKMIRHCSSSMSFTGSQDRRRFGYGGGASTASGVLT